MSSALSFIYSAPDGNQHGNDHDGSGGMRESRHDVDDAGDASNTEIGHAAYLPSRTSIAITPCVRSCRIWGLLGAMMRRKRLDFVNSVPSAVERLGLILIPAAFATFGLYDLDLWNLKASLEVSLESIGR